MKGKAGLHFIVLMAMVAGVVLGGATAQAAPAPTSTPAISVGDVQIDEGTGGTRTASFPVTLDKSSGRILTVDYATTDGSAIAGSDYAQSSGRLTINKRQTQAVVSVPILSDSTDETDETFELRIANPGGGAVIADDRGVGTILDDDAAPPPPPPAPEIRIADVDVTEGTGGLTNAALTVSLNKSWDRIVTVDYGTLDNTALAGSDYAQSNGTVTFNVGQTTRTLNVSVVADSIDEPDELFEVHLNNPGGGAVIADGAGEGRIADDDDPEPPPPAPAEVSIDDLSIHEGTGGASTARFVVRLNKAWSQDVSVDYSTFNDGTATPGIDYVDTTGNVTIRAGELNREIAIGVIADSADEPDETFSVVLSTTATGGATVSDRIAVGTIVDDDEPPADLSVELVQLSGRPFTGMSFRQDLAVRVSNLGPASAQNVQVLVRFAGSPDFFGLPNAQCSADGTDYRCSLGTIAPGTTAEQVVALWYDLPGTYAVTAAGESDTPDHSASNNSKTLVVSLRDRRADLVIAAQYTPSIDGHALESKEALEGKWETVSFAVTNAGPDPVNEFSFRFLPPREATSAFGGATEFAGATGPPGAECDENSCVFATTPFEAGQQITFSWNFFFFDNRANQGSTTQFDADQLSTPANPDGTLVDEVTGNNISGTTVYVASPRYDLVALIHGFGSQSVSWSNQGSCGKCHEYAIGVHNLQGPWRATGVGFIVQIPVGIRVLQYDTVHCSLIGTSAVTNSGGQLICREVFPVVRGGDTFFCEPITCPDTARGNYMQLVVEYLALLGDQTMTVTVDGFADNGQAPDRDINTSNNTASFTRTITS